MSQPPTASSSPPAVLPSSRQSFTVALVGNPNTGKTTLFNALSGLRQRVGNYPGVTVEMKKGQCPYQGRVFHLIDLPGTYSLAPRSPDEMVAVDVLLGQLKGEPRPDVVVTIVDASNLERNLYLTTQVMELGVPVVVALNMMDVARGQGLDIDAERLARQLGVRVVPIQANKGKGLDALKQAVAQAAVEAVPAPGPTFPEAFEREVAALEEALGGGVAPFLVRRLLLDAGGHTERRLGERCGPQLSEQVKAARQRLAGAGCPVPAVEARTRYGWLRTALAGCVRRPDKPPVSWTDRIDRVLTHKVWGTLIFLALMFVVFQSIFTWARPLMKLIGDGTDLLGKGLRDLLPAGAVASLLVDGVLKGVGSVIVFLPQIVILFAFIAILEDCGYMARAAFLMDKLMSRCGLSGKSFIPLLSSVACAVPGIMATRVIENRRDRLATILVAPLMSCSARLPVYILLIGAFLTGPGFPWWVPGLAMFAMYAIGLVLAPLVALALKRTLLRGETPVFIMEMPLYKWPALRTVVRRVTDSGWAFLRRAGTLILAAMIVVWALLYFPRTNAAGESYEELIARIEEPIAEQRQERNDLERSIAEEKKELKRLKRDLAAAPAAEREALEQQRQELQARIAPVEKKIDKLEQSLKPEEDKMKELLGEWKKQSFLGQMGQAIEPAVEPLGWDWRIGVAALASFPAREVVVGTLGIIYEKAEVEDPDDIRDTELSDIGDTKLAQALQQAKWEKYPGRKVFTVPTVLSLMVFFALCCQCASTLVIIKRETNSWRWPAFTFVYMTVLAYIGALLVYQVGQWFV
jgi:ferrous iron transport protein B